MKNLIIYDETGYVLSVASGTLREPVGIPFIWVDIPEGKRAVSVNVSATPNTLVLEDIPKSQTELQQEQIDTLTVAIAAMMGV